MVWFGTVCKNNWVKLAAVVMILGLTLGCLSPKHAGFVVPLHCLKINVQSFTQPCVPRTDGKLVCDGVVITASCVAPSSDIQR
jgi:hypothetical protein